MGLKFLNLLDKDANISITNTVVYVFVLITSFKLLFSGAVVHNSLFTWKVEAVDMSTSLPLLFSLLNYGHKRMVAGAQS
jgi:hypothetical protein